MISELILASNNVHKVREIKEILADLPIEILSLKAYPNYQAPEETGDTFHANARLKAEHAAKELNSWVLADDSGLIVPALNGQPGVYSARYAGKGATDRDNRRKLLKALEDLTGTQRHAYFICVLALASPDGTLILEQAQCEGYLLEQERGSNGHGYDPLFVKHSYSRTFAQIDEATKNRISHRRKAIEKIIPHLQALS